MEFKVAKAVDELLPGCQLTGEFRNLAIHLRLFLDINDGLYHVIQFLMIVTSFNKLKLEEAILAEVFGYRFVAQTHAHISRLVLTRMRMEAKKIQADLKPYYLKEANL